MNPRIALLTLGLLTALAIPAYAQQRVITGRVTGSTGGEPVNSASITVAGTRLGVVTGDDGRYTLSAPAGALQLQVRRIGYRPRLVPVPAGQDVADVVLERDVLQLSELVVTGQATSVARQNAANDIATVSAEELTRAAMRRTRTTRSTASPT